MVTKADDAINGHRFGATQYMASLEQPDRHWVQCLPNLVPSTKYATKSGYVRDAPPSHTRHAHL